MQFSDVTRAAKSVWAAWRRFDDRHPLTGAWISLALGGLLGWTIRGMLG